MVRKITKKGLIRKQDKEWRDTIRERDNYTCQVCMKDCGKRANAHHILPRHMSAFRWDKNNGITLCFYHHKVGQLSAHQNAIWFSEWLKEHRLEQYEYIIKQLDAIK